MDFIAKINALRAKKADLLAKAGTTEDAAELQAIADEMETINGQIANYERLAKESQGAAQPVGGDAPQNGGQMDAKARRAQAVKDLANAARNGFRVRNAVTAGSMANTEHAADGGYMVPEDIETAVYALRGEVPSLLDEVSVRTVSAKSGKRTLRKRTGGTGFATVAEAAKYPLLGAPKFTPVEYQIEKRGGITAATIEVLEYTDEEIANEIELWLAGESRATANRLILEQAKASGTTSLSGLDDIIKAWIGLGSAFRSVSKLITNGDGLAWLATLKDNNDRYLLAPNPSVSGQMQLTVGGTVLPVQDYDNEVLPSDGTKAPMILGSLKDGIVYWQKKGFAIKQSDVAVAGSGDNQLNAYEQDLVLWRGSQWDDCTGWDSDAFIYGEVDTAAAAG